MTHFISSSPSCGRSSSLLHNSTQQNIELKFVQLHCLLIIYDKDALYSSKTGSKLSAQLIRGTILLHLLSQRPLREVWFLLYHTLILVALQNSWIMAPSFPFFSPHLPCTEWQSVISAWGRKENKPHFPTGLSCSLFLSLCMELRWCFPFSCRLHLLFLLCSILIWKIEAFQGWGWQYFYFAKGERSNAVSTADFAPGN